VKGRATPEPVYMGRHDEAGLHLVGRHRARRPRQLAAASVAGGKEGESLDWHTSRVTLSTRDGSWAGARASLQIGSRIAGARPRGGPRTLFTTHS